MAYVPEEVTSPKVCESYCTNPCRELNFAAMSSECGACSSNATCHPGAPGWPRKRIRNQITNFSLSPGQDALCRRLASHHFCDIYSTQMVEFCHEDPGSCRSSGQSCTAEQSPLCDQQRVAWTKASLFDHHAVHNASACKGFRVRPRVRMCQDLEDPRRMKDRGFFVVRGMVPAAELDGMRRFMAQIPKGTQHLCGLSGLQPKECFRGPKEAPSLMPTTHRRLSEILNRWLRLSFHEKAHLGWPLELSSGEFISINRWKHTQNESCILQALFNAAIESHQTRSAKRHATTKGTAWACPKRCPKKGAVMSVCYAWCALSLVRSELTPQLAHHARVAALGNSCALVPPGHTLIPNPRTMVSVEGRRRAAAAAAAAINEGIQLAGNDELDEWLGFGLHRGLRTHSVRNA